MSYPLSHHGHTPNTTDTGDPALSVSSEVPMLASANAPSTGGSAARVHKRRSTKPGTGKQLSKSSSTPQLKTMGNMSDDDKKRNKLGYQRISIACAHCRRRKIRCLLADGDPHQRCQNCIRLKRECVFYPVDQQGTVENQSQASSKTGAPSVPSSGVSPSPPNLDPAKAYEHERQFGGFPSLPSNAPPGFQGLPIEPASAVHSQGDLIPSFTTHNMSDSDATRLRHPEYGYDPHSEAQQQWGTPETFSPQRHAMIGQPNETAQSPYWRPGPSGEFAPFPGGAATMEQMHATPSYTYHPPEMPSWQSQHPPNRSMSYDEMHGVAQPSYLAPNMMYQPHPGQPPGPATFPPLDVHRAAMSASMHGPHSAPVGTPITPYTQAPPYMYQSSGTVSASPLQASPQYHQGVWYPESSPYGPMDHSVQPHQERGPYTTEPPR